jgi:hypothetical protein
MAGRPEGKRGLTVCLRGMGDETGGPNLLRLSHRSEAGQDAKTNRPEAAVRRGISAPTRGVDRCTIRPRHRFT